MATETAGLRERKMARTRSRIADAAIDLFEQHGYDAVTVNDICAHAEVAPRTFFRYFPAKDDLLAEHVREMSAQVAASLGNAPAQLSDVECLRLAMLELGAFVVADQERQIRFLQVSMQSARVRAHPFNRLADREADMVELLAARRDDPSANSWKTRLLVARHAAAFRLWLDDLVSGVGGDPMAHLREMLAEC